MKKVFKTILAFLDKDSSLSSRRLVGVLSALALIVICFLSVFHWADADNGMLSILATFSATCLGIATWEAIKTNLPKKD